MRILLIGNIANNAYHDAKLLRELGFECDVLCPDYYHVMGCPEWEDARFEQAELDDFRPDWTQIDLHDFRRPGWFVQGPLELCLAYLEARDAGRASEAVRHWHRLGLFNRTAARCGIADHAWLASHAVSTQFMRARRLIASPARVEEKMAELRDEFCDKPGGRWLRPAAIMLGGVLRACSHLYAGLSRRLPGASVAEFERRAAQVIDLFDREFPTRADRLSLADLWPYRFHWRAWQALFERYDVVQAFAAEVAVPLIADRPYVAFEHGTLREIPERPTVQGRLTALGYRCAAHTFVTNLDCVEKARQITEGRFTFINHPYDESSQPAPEAVAALRARLLEELDATFLIFHPTRQDWVPGRGYADKANDVLFEALLALRRDGCRVGLVCCSWGNNVTESQDWLVAHGVACHVGWRRPMGMEEFRCYAAASDVVADQFKLGAFGGVTFKALAVGAVLCTYLDEAGTRAMFEQPPPILNCRTAADIEIAVRRCVAEPGRLEEMGASSRQWIARHHRGRDVAGIQARVFEQLAAHPQ